MRSGRHGTPVSDRAARPAVGVLGSGTMGRGIAMTALWAGCPVWLYDVSADMLSGAAAEIRTRTERRAQKGELSGSAECVLARLQTVDDVIALAAVDIVIEAVPERLDLKRDLFRRLEACCRPDAVLATNTSSLSVSEIAAGLTHPQRVVGMHFFNPAAVMPLVEVVAGDATDPDVVRRVVQFAGDLGKQAAVCRDTPGFIVNRVARNFYGEALRIVGEGSADAATVDRLLSRGAGFPMGPFALMDLIGIDVNFAVTESVYQAFFDEPRYRPHPLQARQVAVGQLGRKSGRGFYAYPGAAAPGDGSLPTAADAPTVDPVALRSLAVIGDTALAAALRDHIAAATGRAPEDCGLCFAPPLFAWQAEQAADRAQRIGAWVQQTSA